MVSKFGNKTYHLIFYTLIDCPVVCIDNLLDVNVSQRSNSELLFDEARLFEEIPYVAMIFWTFRQCRNGCLDNLAQGCFHFESRCFSQLLNCCICLSHELFFLWVHAKLWIIGLNKLQQNCLGGSWSGTLWRHCLLSRRTGLLRQWILLTSQ